MSATELLTSVPERASASKTEMSLRDVETTYGREPVLSKVTLDIQRGEFLAIIGPSAGGKSTLLKCMNLLQPLSAGEIHFQGELVATARQVHVDGDQFRRKVGLVHQEWNLWPNKKVINNLTEAPQHVLGLSRKEATELAADWLTRFNIYNIRERYPHELSGGQKQRVAIARALIMDPVLLMMDEITSALDVETTDRLLRLFESLRDENRTFVFVSHHLNFVSRATDRTLVIIEGRVTEIGPSSRVISTPENEETRRFLSTVLSVT